MNKPTIVKQKFFKASTRTSTKVVEQLRHVVDRAHAAGRQSQGWRASFSTPKRVEGGYESTVTLSNQKTGLTAQAKDILKKVVLPAANGTGWIPADQAAVKLEAKPVEATPAGVSKGLEVPEDWSSYFEHIYDRESQIYMVVQAIRAFIKSGYRNRFHVVMYGPPGCGKTEITRAVKAMLGEDNVIEYDATATTAAGAIQDLAGRDDSPRILAIEEIEKTDEASLRWLLAALDQRGELRKKNFRTSIQKSLRVLTIATVNDRALFEKVMAGALASRFPLKLYCPRPSRAVHSKILAREIEREDGSQEWADPAVDFAEGQSITDPRTVTAICLCGGDDLLTGVFQEHFRAVQEPTD